MNNLSCIVMASGHSKRFNGNKLLYELDHIPMIEHTFIKLKAINIEKVFVVARDSEVLSLSEQYSFISIKNEDTTDDTAITIKLGMKNVDSLGTMLIVADQPYLKIESLKKLVSAFNKDQTKIYALSSDTIPKNPVVFPKKYYDELKSLNKNEKGKTVVNRHLDDIVLIKAHKKELEDIDYKP